MSKNENKLRDFLVDINTKKKHKEKYLDDPEKIMDEYCLTDEEKSWIKKGDTESINKSIGDSYFSTQFINVVQK